MAPRMNVKLAHKIIESVKRKPQIWNPRHEDYFNRYLVGVAWKEIATALQLKVDVVKLKWRALRFAYKKEIKRYAIDNVKDYKGTWQFFKAMTFLDNDTKDKLEFVGANDSINEPISIPNPISRTNTEESSTNRRPMKENYDVSFLKSLVPYFKELSSLRKLMMRNRIQELLIKELSLQDSNRL